MGCSPAGQVTPLRAGRRGPAGGSQAESVTPKGAAANPSRLEAVDVLVAVEIISPGTGTTDRVTKMYEYADARIPHYWLVDLDTPVTLTAYTLVDGNYEIVAGP